MTVLSEGKQFTSEMVFGKVVEIEPVEKDRYGRTVALVRVGDVLLNEELVRVGLAWVYPHYCHRPICNRWYVLEVKAHDNEEGLWRDPKPVPPWVFKRKQGKGGK